MSCHSLVKEFFEGRDIEELTQCMFVHIKMQVENSQMSESGFTLDQIMHLCINFHNLALMQDNSYTELAKWIATKKVVINPKNWWAVFQIFSVIPRESTCCSILNINTTGKDLSLTLKRTILISQYTCMLFNTKNSIYTACRSEYNGKCNK